VIKLKTLFFFWMCVAICHFTNLQVQEAHDKYIYKKKWLCFSSLSSLSTSKRLTPPHHHSSHHSFPFKTDSCY